MAITKTTSVQRVETYPPSDSTAEDTVNAGNCSVMVVYIDTMDDPDDDDLPQDFERVKWIRRYTNDEDQTTTIITGEAQLVQDICGAIWS